MEHIIRVGILMFSDLKYLLSELVSLCALCVHCTVYMYNRDIYIYIRIRRRVCVPTYIYIINTSAVRAYVKLIIYTPKTYKRCGRNSQEVYHPINIYNT